jgi:hypothetical protein
MGEWEYIFFFAWDTHTVYDQTPLGLELSAVSLFLWIATSPAASLLMVSWSYCRHLSPWGGGGVALRLRGVCQAMIKEEIEGLVVKDIRQKTVHR